jgi:hypothetical protein
VSSCLVKSSSSGHRPNVYASHVPNELGVELILLVCDQAVFWNEN